MKTYKAGDSLSSKKITVGNNPNLSWKERGLREDLDSVSILESKYTKSHFKVLVLIPCIETRIFITDQLDLCGFRNYTIIDCLEDFSRLSTQFDLILCAYRMDSKDGRDFFDLVSSSYKISNSNFKIVSDFTEYEKRNLNKIAISTLDKPKHCYSRIEYKRAILKIVSTAYLAYLTKWALGDDKASKISDKIAVENKLLSVLESKVALELVKANLSKNLYVKILRRG